MAIIGCHLSVAKGLVKTGQIAQEIGANTFQIFSRNPRGSGIKKYLEKEIQDFKEIRKEYQLGPILAHAPYTMNLAAKNESTYEFSKTVLREDMQRMQEVGIEYINIHPGSHVGEGIEKGIERIVTGINEAIQEEQSIMLLLETMSGKGTEVGFRFEQLQNIIEQVKQKEKVGICMDLCHVFAAGYDIVNHLDEVLEEFDSIIGMDKLKAIHLNDSKMPFASKKDRHSTIGDGEIGWESMIRIMNRPLLKNLPFYLETPLETEGHKKEIQAIRKKLEESVND